MLDLVIYAFPKMIIVPLTIRMMEEELFYAFRLQILVIQATKTMDLGIYVFLRPITVQMDTRMMEDKQFLAFN